MAADGGALRRLFEKPLPENPTLLEALSAVRHHHHHHKKHDDPASFTEIFGELHFQEKPPPPPVSSWIDVADAAEKSSKDDSSLDALLRPKPAASGGVKRSASFCLKSSTSLLLCTEGLGSESTVDADDLVKDADVEEASSNIVVDKVNEMAEMDVDARGGGGDRVNVEERRRAAAEFPPPIRSIGRGGKPCVCFRSFRAEGRFVLMEVVIPGKELLQATREDGRLTLRFAAEDDLELEEDDDEVEGKDACAGRDDALAR
uniref:FAF domain-containing protein n=1 Tax=Leersia perrieri TaxID=77586 RepID=A0A0D9XX12_9ORYZ